MIKILIQTLTVIFQRGLILSLCLILMACGATDNSAVSSNSSVQQPTESTSEAIPESTVERVVALSSLTADLVQELSSTKLVGIPGSQLLSQDPRFQEIETVSSGRTPPNLEKVVALKPDLVLGAAGFHDQIGQRLEEIGITTRLVDVDSWQSLEDITQDLATRLNADPKTLSTRYQSCLAKAPASEKSVQVLVSRHPILSPNKQSWAGDFLEQFNLNNLAADLQGNSPIGGYITLSAEKLLESNPDAIFVIDPTNAGIIEQFEADPFWGKLKATVNQQVYSFDYYGLINPGSIEAIEAACDRLNQVLSQTLQVTA
ncbi:MAG: ABC transporter substrate-binding protein [Microcoleaceae cyanobacterium]